MPGARGAAITVLSGPLAGSKIKADRRLTVGRRSGNGLRLPDERISRFHARIERREDHYIIEDLGSRAGTLVDGKKVTEPTELSDGAEIQVGETKLRFEHTHDPVEEMITGSHTPVFRSQDGGAPKLSANEDRGVLALWPADPESDMRSLQKLDGNTMAELRRASTHLKTLLQASTIISTELELSALFERILDILTDTFPVHRAVILTREDGEEELNVTATRILKARPTEQTPKISTTIANRALEERVGILTLDAGSDVRFDGRSSVVDQQICSALCAPMVYQDQVFGVIYLDTVGAFHPFDEEDLRLLTAIAGAAGGALRNAVLVKKLRETALDTVFRLSVAAEYRDDDTGTHIHRMSDYAQALASALGRDGAYCDLIKIASPMHDVGKIGIPDAILKKPGKLTVEEFEIMKQHTVKGGKILAGSTSEVIRMAHNIALTHHEKFDGSGYPHGLTGEAIPLEGRIVAVADVFDAVMSKRCYKESFGLERSLQILTDGSGKHFDPQVVDAFMAIKPRILQIRDRYEDAAEGL